MGEFISSGRYRLSCVCERDRAAIAVVASATDERRWTASTTLPLSGKQRSHLVPKQQNLRIIDSKRGAGGADSSSVSAIGGHTHDGRYYTQAEIDALLISAKEHGELSGLADDDHAQYALLAGRSGGQTLIGGTGSGDDLVLRSTAHATKGVVLDAFAASQRADDRAGNKRSRLSHDVEHSAQGAGITYRPTRKACATITTAICPPPTNGAGRRPGPPRRAWRRCARYPCVRGPAFPATRGGCRRCAGN
jgi:hypothetical protein